VEHERLRAPSRSIPAMQPFFLTSLILATLMREDANFVVTEIEIEIEIEVTE
jgi:hypothetical protein